MRRSAVRRCCDELVWSALGAGAHQMRVAATVAAAGGHVRVGLEDSLWAGPGQLATSNADQVRMATSLIEGLGGLVASADEARALLKLQTQKAFA